MYAIIDFWNCKLPKTLHEGSGKGHMTSMEKLLGFSFIIKNHCK